MQLFSMPTTGKLLVVLAVAMPVVLAGGFAYKRAIGCSWGEAVTKAYHVMGNCPGSDITREDSKAALLVVNMVYLAGVLGFAVVLGIVTEDIASTVTEVRSGNFPVAERQHTVVLGWNSQTMTTLRQIAIAQAQGGSQKPFGMPVVVLADRDKNEMDREILDTLGDAMPVITRSGSVARLEDIRRTAAAEAGTILLQYPEGKDKDHAAAEQAAALAALKREGGLPHRKVVVQGDGGAGDALDAASVALEALRGVPGAKTGASTAVVGTSGPRRVSQLMAQVALQPGLEFVLGDLLEFEEGYEGGAEFHMETLPERMEGQQYRAVRRSYSEGVVVGYAPPGGKMVLNPGEGERVPPGSQLAFVTGRLSVQEAEDPVETRLPRLRRRQATSLRAKNIVVLCFDYTSCTMLEALQAFCPKGSRVTFVCSDPAAKDGLRALQKRGVRATAVLGSPASGAVLQKAGLENADVAVVCGLGGAAAAGDSQAVATVLQLQALSTRHQSERKRSRPLHVVTTVSATSTEEVLWHATMTHEVERERAAERAAAAAEAEGRRGAWGRRRHAGAGAERPVVAAVELHMMNPQQLMSGMLTQVAIEPRLNQVFTELLTSDKGHEVYLRRAACYGLPPHNRKATQLKWSQVQEAARKRGHTAIGVAPAAGGPDSLRLAPAADDAFDLAALDDLVVIAAE